jgi:DNA-binding NarL/FixJ family response regulator
MANGAQVGQRERAAIVIEATLIGEDQKLRLSVHLQDGRSALALATEENPNVAVIDVSLPAFGGVALAERLAEDALTVRALLFTMHDHDDETIREGLAAAAQGYLLRSDLGEKLDAAISALTANRPDFSPQLSEILPDPATDEPKRSVQGRFTLREREIARMIFDGDSNKEIARRLNLSVRTVENHRAAAMRKAGCRSTAEFVRFAIKHNLVQA